MLYSAINQLWFYVTMPIQHCSGMFSSLRVCWWSRAIHAWPFGLQLQVFYALKCWICLIQRSSDSNFGPELDCSTTIFQENEINTTRSRTCEFFLFCITFSHLSIRNSLAEFTQHSPTLLILTCITCHFFQINTYQLCSLNSLLWLGMLKLFFSTKNCFSYLKISALLT